MYIACEQSLEGEAEIQLNGLKVITSKHKLELTTDQTAICWILHASEIVVRSGISSWQDGRTDKAVP